MHRALNQFTDIAVRQAKPKEKPYKLADGGGMYLEVMPSGSKLWRLKYRLGKEKRYALGIYLAVSLNKACECEIALPAAELVKHDPFDPSMKSSRC